MMLPAIPVLKGPHPGLGLPEAVKAVRVRRVILEGLEAGFGMGVVIGDVRSRQALLDAELSEEPREGFGRHRPAVVGVHRQLLGRELEALEAGGQELLGVVAALFLGDEPADDEATPAAGPAPGRGRSIGI